MKKEKANEETVGLKMADKNADKENDLTEGYSVVVVDGSAGDSSFIDTTEDKFHTKDEPYSGLKKEELLKYANDPYWVRLRIILLVIFSAIWLAMLVAAIVIIVLTPKCPPRPNQEWWETAMVYCIQPKSFFDSDSDGVGDLEGIHSKLGYIKDTLKADAIDLGVIQQSAGKTLLGSDVTSFDELHKQFGSMQDFENLRAAVHKKGMKLILDFVPNHSSDEHPWFLASKNKTEPYTNFYIWHPGTKDEDGKEKPPNNLTKVDGQSAWSFDETRKEYYYHTYSKHMPDLNLSNADVVAKLDEAILHWLRLKVDGIKILGASKLVENKTVSDVGDVDENDITSLPDTIKLINHWRQLLDNQTSSETKRSQPQVRVLLVDMEVVPANLSTFFGRRGSEDTSIGPHLPINKQLLQMDSRCGAKCLSRLMHGWFDSIGKTSRHSNWMMSDATSSRIASRMEGANLLNAISLLLHTLSGATFIHYGDEIGMKDTWYNGSLGEAKYVSFGPMQWNDQDYGGFSQINPWLPVADDYSIINVESQLAHGSGMSNLKVFSKLVSLRKEPSIQWGKFRASMSKNVYYYVRKAEGHPSILVALNLGPMSSTVALRKGKLADDIPATKATILASTYNFDGERAKLFSDNTEVDLDTAILLHPGEGVALKWVEEKSIF